MLWSLLEIYYMIVIKKIGIVQYNIVWEADEKINFENLIKEKQNKQWINMSMINLLIVERKIKIIILILNIVFLISYKFIKIKKNN